MTKVLVIAYYWPPAGGPGVQRWLSFTKYLPDFDIEPVVLVPEGANYPIIDESLLEEVPDDISIHKLKIREPYATARLFLGDKARSMSSGILRDSDSNMTERLALWVRGNFFIPDARKSWVKPAIQKASQLIKEGNIKTVVTTGPPHSVHLIGLGLKKHHELNWIADFRDPWTSIGYHSKLRLTKSSQRKHKELESLVLNSADKLITTSNTTAEEFAKLTSRPIAVITNGFESLSEQEESDLDQNFSLSFIGSLLSRRNPMNLWKSLAELVNDYQEFKAALHIKLIGVVSDQILSSIEQMGLREFIELIPYVEHKKAIELQQSSQVLLLLEIDSEDTKGIIPGKLFEYMAARRPILAIGPKEWEAGHLVRQTGSGCYFHYEDHNAIKSQILQWFQLYQLGKLEVRVNSIEKYTRRSLSKVLAEEIKWG